MLLVQIHGQEEAGFVPEHRIDTHDEGAAIIIPAGKMPANHLMSDWEKTTMGTFGTLDPGLFAKDPNPLIGTRGLVAGLAGPAALETARINVIAPAKERAKENDPRFNC